MADTQTWTEHFGITEQQFQQWRVIGGATPFLTWCLQNGSVNEAAYLQWAASHYHLPIVKDSFFALPTAETNWATGKFLYRWTEDILPLEEWEGVVLIACVEPPQKFQLERPHAFVLASPRQLQVLWHRFFPEAPVAIPASAAAAAAAPVSAPEAAPTASIKVPDFAAAFAAEPPPADGFDPDKLLASFNEQADATAESTEPKLDEHGQPIEQKSDEPFVMPEGFSFDLAHVDIPMPTLGLKSAAPAAPATENPATTVATSVETPAAIIAAPPVEASAPDATMAIPMPVAPAASVTAEQVPVPPAMASPNDYVAPIVPRAPAEFDLCDSIEEVVACAFAKMGKHFQYQLALLPSDEILNPWLWSGKFVRENPGERPNPIDLVTPSFFRIVMRTSMPYHGHTRPSDVNDRFFKEWTQGAALPQVTIVPIIIDENPAIFLFGGMDNVIEPRAALSDMEHWARSAAMACRRISEKPATAAA